jgi:hypothetical protein
MLCCELIADVKKLQPKDTEKRSKVPKPEDLVVERLNPGAQD